MVDFFSLSGAALGVLFNEALRIYKKINAGKKWIPNAGEKNGILIYLIVVLIFCMTAAFLSAFVANNSPGASLIFGMSVPQGLRTIKPSQGNSTKGDELIEDEWSNIPNYKDKVVEWIRTYYN